jgi:alcohol dehydrogenase
LHELSALYDCAHGAELGAREADIEKLAHTACYGNGGDGTLHGFTTLEQKDVQAIYRLMV